MAISNPKVRLRKKSSKETQEEHARRAVERGSECAEADFDVETPVYIPPPRTATRRVRFHVTKRVRWTPNLNFPDTDE